MARRTLKHFKIMLLLVGSSIIGFVYYFVEDFDVFSFHNEISICGIGCKAAETLEYVIHTPTCTIPAFNSDHPLMKRYSRRVTEPEELVCSNVEPLMEASGLNLIFHQDRIKLYTNSEHIKCYYEGIVRIEQDSENYDEECDRRYKLKEKIPIKSQVTPIEEDGIIVTCESWITIYRDAFYFLQPRRSEKKKHKFQERYGQRRKKPKQLNVIMMGTDSVSRVNLERFMPKTLKYLTENLEAFDFKGFNKVADNTNPNVVAMLTGWSMADVKKFVSPLSIRESKADNYPFIWKNFSDKGYVTVYAEDSSNIGTFTYGKYGFVKEPTDYYFRAFSQAFDDTVGHNGHGWNIGMQKCTGPRKTIKVIHNISLNVAETMKDVPYFSFCWTSSITHNDLDLAALADQPSVDYLKKLHDGGYLEQAVLFFFSDHGIRFGNFRETYPGMIEERMPYLMIRLPAWFRKQYPQIVKHMMVNTRRLTSNFDIFGTLKDILRQSYGTGTKKKVPPLRWGQSLFQEVPLNRTCKDAGIPEHYCTCQSTKEADPQDTHVLNAVDVVMEELNNGLKDYPNCTQLSIDKVIGGRIELPKIEPERSKMMKTMYMVTFKTKPGGGVMEATVKYQNGYYILSSDVSRINMYGNQSHCIDDYIYKKYCFCKDLLAYDDINKI